MQSRKQHTAAIEWPGQNPPIRKPPQLAALARNVASQRWVEEALAQSEDRCRILAETALDAIVTIDKAGEILFVNPSAERIFGYPASEMVGQNLTLLALGYSPAETQREITGRRKDGQEIPLEVSFGEFTHGAQTLSTGVLRDISRRKRDEQRRRQAEEELRQVNEGLRGVIEATPVAIVTLDLSENVSTWNSAAEKMFGWSEAEIVGRPLPAASGRQTERLPIIETARRGQSLTLETKRQRKDGGVIDVSISIGQIASADGALVGAVAVITDITEHKRFEDRLRQAQKMEAVGRLAGGIGHDFNNLLTVITGFGDMLLSSLAPEARARGYALEILQASEKATALTKQLLAFSRRQVTHPTPLDVNPLVTNLSNMLRRLIGEHIDLSILLSPDAGTVRVDPSQIEQIIVNLVVNARDAMPGGGRITIETGVAQLGPESSQAHLEVEPGRFISIAVTDTGHGMTQRTKSQIFEPFFTTKGEGQGTGLGLSTIYGIVKQNHGDIWVYSEPGKGSTFKVYLPAGGPLPATVESLGNHVLERGRETILVVEDEAGLRVMIQELLERLGYVVLTAGSSQEAVHIASIHSGNVHLLLTDVVMPKVSGRELAEQLRYMRRHTRVLYMSGYPPETIVQNGALQPGAAFLEKPFTPETLARKVRDTLDAKASPVL